ncbi:hypothetical protein [Streptomyces sp. ISL-94]|uniref:hypothetical protein n=1 Tax=Streptomyces sp. ISL-94 TaxID=2819190 RepID=UPI001BEA9E55|nr:hypothetical protein [Streptomyces sp. ISL-94]MBT2478118.1 hypothetical protein [Streptomyces sp. ISL-94]
MLLQATSAEVAAQWICGAALEVAARGQLWRSTHPTLAAYCEDFVGIKEAHARCGRARRSASPWDKQGGHQHPLGPGGPDGPLDPGP